MPAKSNSGGGGGKRPGISGGAVTAVALNAGGQPARPTLAQAKAENRAANQRFVASMARLSPQAIQGAAERRGYNDLWRYPGEVTKRTLDAVYKDALTYARNALYYQNASQVTEGLTQWKLINPPPLGSPAEFTPEEAGKLASHYEGFLRGWAKAADMRWGGYDITKGRAVVRNGRIVGYTLHSLVPGAEGLAGLATWLKAQ